MPRALILAAIVLLAAASLMTGCGEETGITRDDHGRIELGMSMDDVESVLGQPERSHVTGASQNPTIYWYFTKQEGDGLVKISFEEGKVTNVAPYDDSFEVGE